MSVTLKIEGLAEFQKALRALPVELTSEAQAYVLRAAQAAANSIIAGYPTGPTGNLKRGVSASRDPGSAFGVRAVVKNRAFHSHIFESGTGDRKTSKGWPRGRTKPAPHAQAFIPKAIRERQRMVEELVRMLERQGFVVSGVGG